MRLLKRLLIILVVFYLIALVFVYVKQRSFIYFPSGQAAPQGFAEISGAQSVGIRVDGVGTIQSYFRAPPVGGNIVIYFHGNGSESFHGTLQAKRFQEWNIGYLLAGYPGYSLNPGNPSEASFLPSALAHFDWLVGQGIEPGNIVLYGHSLGAASAVFVASERKAGHLVLSAPFLSAKAMGRHRMPYFPTGVLLKDQFRSDLRMANVEEPLLVFHGDKDLVIPIEMGEALTRRHLGKNKFVRIENGNHSNLWQSNMPTMFRDAIYRHASTDTP